MPVGTISPGSAVTVTPDDPPIAYTSIEVPSPTMPVVAANVQALALQMMNFCMRNNIKRTAVAGTETTWTIKRGIEVYAATLAASQVVKVAVALAGTTLLVYRTDLLTDFTLTIHQPNGSDVLVVLEAFDWAILTSNGTTWEVAGFGATSRQGMKPLDRPDLIELVDAPSNTIYLFLAPDTTILIASASGDFSIQFLQPELWLPRTRVTVSNATGRKCTLKTGSAVPPASFFEIAGGHNLTFVKTAGGDLAPVLYVATGY